MRIKSHISADRVRDIIYPAWARQAALMCISKGAIQAQTFSNPAALSQSYLGRQHNFTQTVTTSSSSNKIETLFYFASPSIK